MATQTSEQPTTFSSARVLAAVMGRKEVSPGRSLRADGSHVAVDKLFAAGQPLQRRIKFVPATRGDAHSAIPVGLTPLKPATGRIRGGQRLVGITGEEETLTVNIAGPRRESNSREEVEGKGRDSLVTAEVIAASQAKEQQAEEKRMGISSVELQWKTIRPIVSQ